MGLPSQGPMSHLSVNGPDCHHMVGLGLSPSFQEVDVSAVGSLDQASPSGRCLVLSYLP